MDDFVRIFNGQKKFFKSHGTLTRSFREEQLRRFDQVIRQREADIFSALASDLGKSNFESYVSEVGLVLEEIKHFRRHLKSMIRPKKVRTPLTLWPAASRIYPEPLGVCLIIAPWNYPFQLALMPLIAAIAAGNCAVLKPSSRSKAVSQVLSQIINDTFAPEHVAVIEGSRTNGPAFLEQPFDLFFFTGSTNVGKKVYAAAARFLAPAVLELGGKNPCIVDYTADLGVAGKRIVWGKFFNAGQTCVAPDYIIADERIKDSLIGEMKKSIAELFGDEPKNSRDFGRMIDKRHFEEMVELINRGTVVLGGTTDEEELYVAPTIMEPVTWEDPVMENEIFGPILPVVSYANKADIFEQLTTRPKPLALYLFSKDKKFQKHVIKTVPYGGGCVNDTLVHFSSSHLPIGGVGQSGLGKYHGHASFDTFSHYKSVVQTPNSPSVDIRYPPYKEWKLNLIRKLMG